MTISTIYVCSSLLAFLTSQNFIRDFMKNKQIHRLFSRGEIKLL